MSVAATSPSIHRAAEFARYPVLADIDQHTDQAQSINL